MFRLWTVESVVGWGIRGGKAAEGIVTREAPKGDVKPAKERKAEETLTPEPRNQHVTKTKRSKRELKLLYQ